MRDTKLGRFAAGFAVAGTLSLGAAVLSDVAPSVPAIGTVVSGVAQVEQLVVPQSVGELAVEVDYGWG